MSTITRANWHVSYLGGPGGGLRLGACDYAGVRVIHSAAVPFVYVDYVGNSSGPFTDNLDCKDTLQVRDVMNGFDLKASYDFGDDYLYEHVWRFHDDGQFGAAIVVHGPGEEIRGRHTYHLPFRLDLDVSGSRGDSFQKRSAAGRWSNVARESRHEPTAVPGDDDWRVVDHVSGRSARIRARAGDDAELWVLSFKRAESLSAVGGTLPGLPGSPGSVPALFSNNETVQNTDLVLWYIAHLSAFDRVAAVGPWVTLDGFPHVPSM
jgi:hypothetical protein